MDQDPLNSQTIIVPPGQAPLRLDIFLVQHADLSRSKLQQAIKAGRVTVNGQPLKPHHLIHPGDVISVVALAAPLHAAAKTTPTNVPAILDETADFLVVNKPSGLVVHGGPGIHEPTLADWAVAHDPAIAEGGDQPAERPGIVHRLDRDVSGVMVIAKTPESYDDLKRQFQGHTVTKEYVALVHGRITTDSGRIDFAIARSPSKSGLMVARPKSAEGKQAETKFMAVRFVKGMTLVRVRTLTGRTHQIRVHFKAIGHPLVGDPLYKIRRLKVEKYPAPRVWLHAELLAFDDLAGKRREYRAPLPKDLEGYLSKVG